MKITKSHLAHMSATIAPLDTPELRKAYKDAGLTDKRYRWDLSYRAGLTPWFCSEVYGYANDDHIDTALRSIVPAL